MKTKLSLKLSLFVAIAFILLSCDLGISATPDEIMFQNEFLSSYMVNQEGVSSGRSASISIINGPNFAVAPVWNPGNEGTLVNNGTHTVADYPEMGLNTSWKYKTTSTLSEDSKPVWKVIVTTKHPNVPYINKTVETYFIEDTNEDDLHTAVDKYVDKNGNFDTKYRQNFRTFFVDGTRRNQSITGQADEGLSHQYAMFDINGSLDYATVSAPGYVSNEAFNPWENGRWSSLVTYRHNMRDSLKLFLVG
jgi:hypothetical protein